MARFSLAAVTMVSAVALTLGPLAQARPPASQPMDDRIVQRQDLAYRFETQDIDSADGQRHYRLWIAIPKRAVPRQGFPVAYLLDGNAAVGELTPELLQELAQGTAPVLVAVGYATVERIDRANRTLDYTPRLSTAESSGPQPDPLTGQPSGGADAFLDLLESRIKPAVARRATLDSQRQTLWGHSYGGLLVLHALLTRPGSFQTYAAASPSLWWGTGVIDRERQGFAQRLGQHHVRLLLMRGDEEPAAPPMVKLTPQPADHAARSLLESFQGIANLHSEYKSFPGLGHGAMLPQSLRYTLRRVSLQP